MFGGEGGVYSVNIKFEANVLNAMDVQFRLDKFK